jgi:response regulator RpfG family c-di-GMP phosphodiesterase
MNDKMLFVDDEPAVLEGYKRILHKDFQPDTASGGPEALASLSQNGPYAVVVSDMRMPGMDGVQLLSRVRELSPDTVRVILTGFADIQSAMNAVNEGNIFRFLTKPCEHRTLKQTLTSCLLQYQLVTAEKELLENTLMGSIKVLTDVLSLSNPAAFGRSVRIRRYVEHMVKKLQLESPWRFEVAALLSQLGCITLDTDLIEAAYCGKKLSPEEQTRFDMHPSVARNLLSNIPRLEGIAWIVGQQRFGAASTENDMPDNIKQGAAILRVAIAFDDLKLQGRSETDALAELRRDNQFDPTMVAALESLTPVSWEKEPKVVPISDLAPGMILEEEVKTNTGLLLVAKGQEVTYPLLVRLKNFHQRKAISDKVLVLAPPTP